MSCMKGLKKMETARLGNTELMVSQIGFGALPLQGVDRESAASVASQAYARGINFFDTARAYTTSEGDLGRALGHLEKSVVVATKTLYRDMEQLDRDFHTSMEQLQRTYIDLYQFHAVNYDHQLEVILKSGGPMDYLRQKQRLGLVRHIGITSHRLAMMLKIVERGGFETIQFPFNYIEQEPLEQLFPLAQRSNLGVIVMKPLAGGVLSSSRAGLKWVLSHPGLVPIPGMCRLSELEDNLAALSEPLDEAEKAQLEADRQKLGSTFCRRCEYCLPCPQEIKPSFIASAALYFNRHGWNKLEESHVEGFVRGLSCSACGECASRCPYELPLTEMIAPESRMLLERALREGKISSEDFRRWLTEAGLKE